MTAFVDESLRQGPGGLYVVAAVVVLEDSETARSKARSVLLGRQKRFHWRNETERQRKAMLGCLAGLGAPVLAYAASPVERPRQDRARALCLERLLWDVWDLGVAGIVFESREDHNDAKDRRSIIQAQRARRADPGLSYDFKRPLEEPLLWFADAAASAVSTALLQGEGCGTLLADGQLRLERIDP